MTAVCVAYTAAGGVNNRVKGRQKQFRGAVLHNQVVGACQRFGWATATKRCGSDHGAAARHEDRGRYTLIRYLGDDDAEPPSRTRHIEEVVKIATDDTGGQVCRGKIPAG